MTHISDIFYPYITNIQNVEGDLVNYEYIRCQLKDELQSRFHTLTFIHAIHNHIMVAYRII